MKKKVAFFSSHIHWNPHYETELELIQRTIDAGDKVYQISCNGEWGVCDTNIAYDVFSCQKCISRRKLGLDIIEGKVKQVSYSEIYNQKQFATKLDFYGKEFDKIKSIQELKKYKIDNFEVGMGVLSSFISIVRESNPNFDKYRGILRKYFLSSVYTYFACLIFLENTKIDVVYLFNGRFAHTRAILRAAQHLSIPCRIHERGSSKNKYHIFENKLPHDISYFVSRVESFWNNQQEIREEREKIASDFFSARRGGKETVWTSFTSHQENILPYNWDKNKKNIVIFNSSEDEFQAISDEWEFVLFKNQIEGIRYLKEFLKDKEDFHVYLRIHPNLSKVDPKEIKELFFLESERFTVISPQSPINSYLLMQNAYKVVTFGSTIGLEATFWGKISIMLGTTFYEKLDVTYNPKSKKEVDNLLLDPHLEAKDKLGAIKYGYYLSQYGTNFKYYTPKDLFSGVFNGTDILHIEKIACSSRKKSVLAPILSIRDKFYLFRKNKNLLFKNDKKFS